MRDESAPSALRIEGALLDPRAPCLKAARKVRVVEAPLVVRKVIMILVFWQVPHAESTFVCLQVPRRDDARGERVVKRALTNPIHPLVAARDQRPHVQHIPPYSSCAIEPRTPCRRLEP